MDSQQTSDDVQRSDSGQSRATQTTLVLGSTLGPYRLLAKLGEGGMGAVYKAQHTKLDKLVAIKVLPEHLTKQKASIGRFEREMKAVGKLNHPNIVAAHDAGEINGIHYLAMEFVEGTDLQQIVKTRGPLSVVQACKVIRQSALALTAAHAMGLVHRDIKPANLLLAKSGQIKLLDLGLALLGNETDGVTELTAEGQTFGTPDYMAPEQWENAHTADARTDLYALGCTLHFLLLGYPPYGTEKHRTITAKMKAHVTSPIPPIPNNRGEIPDGVASIYLQLLAKSPIDRIQSAANLAEALAPFTSTKNNRQAIQSALPITSSDTFHTIPVPNESASSTGEAGAQSTESSNSTNLVTKESGPGVTPSNEPQIAGPVPADSSRMPPRRSGFLLASFGAAFLILCGVIIITITSQDGKKTVLRVPEGTELDIPADSGSKVSIAISKGTTPATESGKATGWHGWPAQAPKPAVAPFDSNEAKKHQDAWAKYLNVPVEYTNSIGMKFRLIPPGEFMMGGSQKEIDAALTQVDNANPSGWDNAVKCEAPRHKVTLTHALYVGIYEVRQMDYEKVLGGNPSHYVTDIKEHPVEAVRWNDAIEFCNALSKSEKFQLYYFLDGNQNGIGYRLLTEAEWEYSCRAGTLTRFWTGDTDAELSQAAWFGNNGGNHPQEVGKLLPNPFGLYDSLGNVWEWVQDGRQNEQSNHSYSSDRHVIDPVTSIKDYQLRVIRGGSFRSPAYQCRSSCRGGIPIGGDQGVSYGFRVALTVDAVRQNLKISGPIFPTSEIKRPVDVAVYSIQRESGKHVLAAGGTVVLESGERISGKDELPFIPSNVQKVHLDSVRITDDVSKALQGFHRLESLCLNRTRIPSAGLAEMLTLSQRLTVLNLEGSTLVGQDINLPGSLSLREFHCPANATSEQLKQVVQSCPLLKKINLSGTTGLNLQILKSLRYLDELTCDGDLLTQEAVKILTAIPSFHRLTCKSPLSDDLAARISKFGAQLQTLELVTPGDEKSGLTDAGCAVLGNSLSLFHLTVRGAKGSPGKAGLIALASMPDLKSMTIRTDDAATTLSASDMTEFQKRHPSVTLTADKRVLLGLSDWPEGGDGGIAAWDLPKEAPPPVIAPFSMKDAQTTQTAWAAYLNQDLEVKNSLGMTFRLIPPGEMLYPYPDRYNANGKIDSSRRSLSRLTKPYYLGATEVTIEQFRQFINETGYKTETEIDGGGLYVSVVDYYGWSKRDHKLTWKKPGPWLSQPGDPASQISWKDAVAFCQWLSLKEKTTYRLPTEMEWFHAFWAGSNARWGLTNDTNEIVKLARLRNSIPSPQEETSSPVHVTGSGKSNAYGLSDMIGNVWEIVDSCQSFAPQNGNQIQTDDIQGPLVVGAAWSTLIDSTEGSAWCAGRVIHPASNVGFRILRQIDHGNSAESRPILTRSNLPLSNTAKVSRPPKIAGLRSWSLEPKRHTESATALAIHPTQELLVTGGRDGALRVWTIKGELRQCLLGHASVVNSIQFFDKGEKLLSSDGLGELRIWNFSTGATLCVCRVDGPKPVALSPDEKTIAAFCFEDLIVLMDIATGVQKKCKAVRGCTAVAWSPDSKYLATTSENSSIHIWQVSPWKQVAEIPVTPYYAHAQLACGLSWSPDSKTIAFSPIAEGKVDLIDGNTFQLLPGIERPHRGSRGAAWSHDGRRLLAINESGSTVFEVGSKKPLCEIPRGIIHCWTLDDSKIYSDTGECFDASTGELLQKLTWSQNRPATESALSANGHFLATTDESGQSSIWDTFTGQLNTQWAGSSIQAPPFWSPDGQFAVLLKDGDVHLVDPSTGAIHRKIPAHSGKISQAAFSPKGDWLATSGRQDQRLRVFDTQNGQLKWESDSQKSSADHIAWSPDGKRIATSHNQSGEIGIWNFENGNLLKSYGPDASPQMVPFANHFRRVVYLQWSLHPPELFIGNYPFGGFTLDFQTETCQDWSWHTLTGGHAISSTLAPNCELRLYHNTAGMSGCTSTSAGGANTFLGQLGTHSLWVPDSRRFLLPAHGLSATFGYDLITRRRLGTLYPISIPNVWLCIGPTGHYRSGFVGQPADGTDLKAVTEVEDFLVYVAQAEDGSQITYTPREFREKFGWKNNPEKATLLKLHRE